MKKHGTSSGVQFTNELGYDTIAKYDTWKICDWSQKLNIMKKFIIMQETDSIEVET